MKYEVEIKRAGSKWQWLAGGIAGGAALAVIAGKMLAAARTRKHGPIIVGQNAKSSKRTEVLWTNYDTGALY